MSMKIGSGGIDKINSDLIARDLKRIKQNEEDVSNISAGDKVELSSRAMDLKEMQTQAMATPDVNSDKVNAIKMQIESGTYKINNEEIAEKLIQEALGY
jgi:negative regulator of flagellin synthesis FlgM